jgi:putative transposase
MGTKGTPQVKRRRHTPEQITRKLREADRLLSEGKSTAEVARHLEISEQTFHRWRNQYGGMKADDAKRLKELEKEDRRLKTIVADQQLENQVLKEIAKGNSKPASVSPSAGHAKSSGSTARLREGSPGSPTRKQSSGPGWSSSPESGPVSATGGPMRSPRRTASRSTASASREYGAKKD